MKNKEGKSRKNVGQECGVGYVEKKEIKKKLGSTNNVHPGVYEAIHRQNG